MGKKEPRNVWTGWHADLEAARDLRRREQESIAFVLRWFLQWAERQDLLPGRDAARTFWRTVVMEKERAPWQLAQWESAIHWYLDWLELVRRQEGLAPVPSLAQRVHRSVMDTGARRGLAYRTRQTYSGWCRRFAATCSTPGEVMDERQVATWLGSLVTESGISFATQKQALNALVFFFRDVCGKSEVHFEVRLKRTGRRVPVVMSVEETRKFLQELHGEYRIAASLMYGTGLRLNELLNLRVKDLDFERAQVVVRGGKGDEDRVVMLPPSIVEVLRLQLEHARELHEQDRAAGLPAVFMPKALGRKYPGAGTSWEWFWVFPAPRIGKIPRPESGADIT